MKAKRTIKWIAALAVLLGSQQFGGTGNGTVFGQDGPPPMPGQEQVEVLTRGPVHEAFAEPATLQVEAGLIVSRQPPANIEEIPPADRPEGDHFVWVPGYWGWDSDRNDYIWVSACWRVGPPNTYWVPGYWAPVADVAEVRRAGVHVAIGGLTVNVGGRGAIATAAGYEWVSGFWASNDAKEIEYLPAPPAPFDLTPTGASPSDDNMWVPGAWYWQDQQYVRRPGYWMPQRANWVWEPSHYRWTPRGYVFEAGHWDYSLERRGVLFAPAYIPRSVYSRSGYSYSPSIAIDLGALSINLFAYPRYSHYYFGDYYDDAYLSMGIYPRYESERRHTYYDSLYTYDRWRSGHNDSRWVQTQRQEYDHRRSNKDLRPARTYREMESRVAKMPAAQRRTYELARPVKMIAATKGSALKFEQINNDARQKISRQAADAHKFRDERSKWEATGSTNPRAPKPADDKHGKIEADRRGPAEHKDLVKSPADRRGPVAGTPRETPEPVAPREVYRDKPERVKLPAQAPIVGRPARGGDTAPEHPVHEKKIQADKDKADAKDARKADAKDKANAKDDAKDDARDARKDKADAKADAKDDARDARKDKADAKADAKDDRKGK